MDGAQDVGNALTQPDSHFPDITTQMIDQGHTQGPGELDRLDILTDGLSVNGRQIFQPLTSRLRTSIGTEEANIKNRFQVSRRIDIDTYAQAQPPIQFHL
jgi:hypothetical protein